MLAEKKLHFQTSYCENHIPHKQPESTNVKAKTVSPPTAPCSDCRELKTNLKSHFYWLKI